MISQARENNHAFCSRFGSIAVDLGYITNEQLTLALDEQVEDDLSGRPHRVLGAICFAQGWMTPEQIDQVLNQMFKVRVKGSAPGEVAQYAAI